MICPMPRRRFPCRQGKARAAPCGAALVADGRVLRRGAAANPSTVPAELLRRPRRALTEFDVDQGRSGEVHRLVEGAAEVLRVFDVEALAAEGVHHAVVAGAVN